MVRPDGFIDVSSKIIFMVGGGDDDRNLMVEQ